MYPFIAVPAEQVRDYLKGYKEMAAAAECKGLEEKVNSWTEGVLDTSNNG
jgi:hypothetical protein